MRKKTFSNKIAKPNKLQEAYYHSLKTHEEEKISKKNKDSENFKNIFKPLAQENNEENLDDDDDDECIDIDLSKLDLKNGLKADNLADIALRLILKKKITAENSFDLPIFNITDMKDFQQKFSKLIDWKKLSFALEAEAQIYGHRVDYLHTYTHKIMGSLLRSYFEGNLESLENLSDINRLPLKAPLIFKAFDSGNDKYIEKNLGALNASKYEIGFDIDPLFSRTSAKFDESAATGLLLNNLTINNSLKMELSSFQEEGLKKNTKENSLEIQNNPLEYKKFQDLNINWEISYIELFEREICQKDMSYLLKEMTLQIQNLENFEIHDHDDKDFELPEDPPFENPYFINNENEDHEEQQEYEEKQEKIEKTSIIVQETIKKQGVPCSNKKIIERPLNLEGIEERNMMMGLGNDINMMINSKEVSKRKKNEKMQEEPSGNSKRRSKRQSLKKFSITFDMKEQENLESILPYKPKKKFLVIDQTNMRKDLFVIPLDLHIKEDRFKKHFLRDFSSNEVFDQPEIIDSESEMPQIDGGIFQEEEEIMNKEEEYQEFEEIIETQLIEKTLTKNQRDGRPIKVKNIAFSSYVSMKQLKDQVHNCVDAFYTIKKDHSDETLLFSNLIEIISKKLSKHQKSQASIMHLCFLSILHLAAECNLKLISSPINPNDFLIIRLEQEKTLQSHFF